MRRKSMVPWLVVAGGAFMFWTLALGLGIPSLARVLGQTGPARMASPHDVRCVSATSIDGKVVEFGDCFSVRLVPDSPSFPRPAVLPSISRAGQEADEVYAGPDPEVTDEGEELEMRRVPPLEEQDSVGRTAY